jgi:hypothetical protein
MARTGVAGSLSSRECLSQRNWHLANRCISRINETNYTIKLFNALERMTVESGVMLHGLAQPPGL